MIDITPVQLTAIAESLGLTLQGLSLKCGLEKMSYTRWLRGKKQIPWVHAETLYKEFLIIMRGKISKPSHFENVAGEYFETNGFHPAIYETFTGYSLPNHLVHLAQDAVGDVLEKAVQEKIKKLTIDELTQEIESRGYEIFLRKVPNKSNSGSIA